MKRFKITAIALVLVSVLTSCGGFGKHPATAEGFSKIEQEIKDQFGDDAYFTDLTIINVKPLGNLANVTVTKDPESMKMGEWGQVNGAWQQNAEVTLEVPAGTKAKDFMFQLNEEINLRKMGELIEKSQAQLKSEKQLDNTVLSLASVKFPDNGDKSKAEYMISLEPENGGTKFSFFYTLQGELTKMDY